MPTPEEKKVVRLQIILTVEDLETGHQTEQVFSDVKRPDGFAGDLLWNVNRQLDPIYDDSDKTKGYRQRGPVEYRLEFKDWSGNGKTMPVAE